MKFRILVIALLCAILLALTVVDYHIRHDNTTIPLQCDYQFNVDSSGYQIYTEDMKLVDTMKWGENPKLDDIIQDDNK